MCVIRLVVGGTNVLDQTMICAFHYFISTVVEVLSSAG